MVSKSVWAAPSSSAARHTRPRSRAASRAAQASPSPPTSADAGSCTPARRSRAWLRESTSFTGDSCTPAVAAGTRNRLSPAVSPGVPAVRATTTKASAPRPSTTKTLSPVSTQPSPSRRAARAVPAGSWRGCSSSARAMRRSPAIRAGSHSDCCAAEPASSSTEPPSTMLDGSGAAPSLLPICSNTAPRPLQPKSRPPRASGKGIALQPRFTISCHRAGSKPSALPSSRSRRWALTGLRAARNSLAVSASRRCSSE